VTRRDDYEREFSDRTDSARINEAYIQQFTLVLCDGARPGLPRDLWIDQHVAESHAPLVNHLVARLRRFPLTGGHILHAPNGRTYWRERIDLRRLPILDRHRGRKFNRRAEDLGDPASHYEIPTLGRDDGVCIDLYITADDFLVHGSSWGTSNDFGRASADLLRTVERHT